jgi:gas vesicle protein
MSGKRSGAFAAGMLLGAAVGAVAGLLVAPRTGQETRRILKKSADALPDLAEDVSTTVQIQADRFSETAVKNWDSTLNRLRDAMSAGIEATRQEQQAQTKTANTDETVAQPTAETYANNHYQGGSSVASEID